MVQDQDWFVAGRRAKGRGRGWPERHQRVGDLLAVVVARSGRMSPSRFTPARLLRGAPTGSTPLGTALMLDGAPSPDRLGRTAPLGGGRGLHEDPRPAVSYTHLRAHETVLDLVCRLLL